LKARRWTISSNTFPNLIKQYGKKDSTDVHDVGHTEKFHSVVLPRIGIRIRNFEAILSPAHVIMKSIGLIAALETSV
jgi:hypothetical protein